MSGWTIITLRGKPSKNYEHSEYNENDPWQAQSDICATMEQDDRVRKWTTWKDHVYAYLECERYDFEFAEDFMRDYSNMARDAVVLGANDTSDTGTARYYPNCVDASHSDEYEESQVEDGHYVGEIALSVINSRNGIVARDPFHNKSGGYKMDEYHLEDGNVRGGES